MQNFACYDLCDQTFGLLYLLIWKYLICWAFMLMIYMNNVVRFDANASSFYTKWFYTNAFSYFKYCHIIYVYVYQRPTGLVRCINMPLWQCFLQHAICLDCDGVVCWCSHCLMVIAFLYADSTIPHSVSATLAGCNYVRSLPFLRCTVFLTFLIFLSNSNLYISSSCLFYNPACGYSPS